MISMDKIYLLGSFVMLVTLIMGIWSLVEKWIYLILPDKISLIAGLIMTSLWVYFFYFLYKSSKPIEFKTTTLKSDNEILKLMQGG